MRVAQENDRGVRRNAVAGADPGLSCVVGVSTDFKLGVDLPGGSILSLAKDSRGPRPNWARVS